MGKNRFLFLLQNLRFSNRGEKKKINLHRLRDLLGTFVHKCKAAYTPSEYVTFDEKLEAFRGCCGFLQYIPSKPNKYGLKIYAISCEKMFYTTILEVYLGKQPQGLHIVAKSVLVVVLRIWERIKGTRHIMSDNWFAEIDLIYRLIQEIVTIRKNKRVTN